MNQNPLFTVPIFIERIDYSIEKLCYKAYEKDPKGVNNSNLGGWHSGNINYPDSPFFFILSDIEKICQEICVNVLKIDRDVFIGKSWININRKGNSNLNHSHPQCILSGVYYVKTPENSGNLVLMHPAYDMMTRDWSGYNIDNYNDINSLTMTYTSAKGILYVFPSWVKHYVESNKSDEERISISFNIA